MSRSGYSEDIDNWALIKWRGQVASAVRGKRGQRLLVDLLAALDAMPDKALVIGELETTDGDVCGLGALGKVRGLDMSKIDPEDPPQVAAAFDIAEQLAREIVFINDDEVNYYDSETRSYIRMTPELRWKKMRKWVAGRITKGAAKS